MTKQKHPLSMWVGGFATLALVGSMVTMVGCTAHVGPRRRPVVRKKVVVHKQPVVRKKVVIVK